MTAQAAELYSNIHESDPLDFWPNQKPDYARISEFLDFKTNELSKIGGISQSSVRLDKKIPRALKERLDQIANTCTLVAEYFDGDPVRTVLWFKTPNPMLGNISPRDMIRLGRYKKLMSFVMDAKQANLQSGQ